EERDETQIGASRAQPGDERAILRAERKRWIREKREVRGLHRPTDEHITAAVARHDRRTQKIRAGAAQERRPLEPGIDDERQSGITIGHFEAVAPIVEYPETAKEPSTGAVRERLPRRRCRLAQRPSRRVNDERAVR